MKLFNHVKLLGLLVLTGLLFACGDGGGGEDTKIFIMKVKTVAVSNPTYTGLIGSINDLQVTLPAGVTVYPATTGVTASGNAAGGTVAVNTTGQTTKISLAKAAGFAVGEFLTVSCGYSGATPPTLASITVAQGAEFKIADLQGNPVTSSFTIEKF
jgi:hypothetical protein